MGYTHYWSMLKAPRGQARDVESRYQEAITLINVVALKYSATCGGLSGYTAHTFSCDYGGVELNGSEGSGICETFSLREHYRDNEEQNFCKTRQYPYDDVVTAALCILHTLLGDVIRVSSDGYITDWTRGLYLARQVLDYARMPDGMRKPPALRAV